MRIALLANPGSGGQTEASEVRRELEAHGATVADAGDPSEPAGDFGAAERVVVAGGDGSVGPAAEAAAGAGLELAVVPTGTANNFAKAMGIPGDLADACRLAARSTEVRPVELCRMGERPFVNSASAGLAVVAARSAGRWKRALGPVAYAVGAVVAGLRAPTLACEVTTDGERLFEGDAWQVVVAGTGAFGTSASVGSTEPADGLLDIVVLEAGSRWALVRRAYGLQRGTIRAQDGVHHRRASKVDFAGGAAFNVDGEITPATETASFSIEPGGVRLVVG